MVNDDDTQAAQLAVTSRAWLITFTDLDTPINPLFFVIS